MTRCKGEVSRADIMRKWPHHVALAADKVRGIKNDEIVRGFADTLSVAPRPYHVRRDHNEFRGVLLSQAGGRRRILQTLRWRALAGDAAAMAVGEKEAPIVDGAGRKGTIGAKSWDIMLGLS